MGEYPDHCTTLAYLDHPRFLTDANSLQAYVSGNALIILDRPNHVLQTIYIDEEFELEAVALDVATGKIAACSTRNIYIYRPYGQDEGAVKVCRPQWEEVFEC